jgi:pyrroline-5-carboxylate reductase
VAVLGGGKIGEAVARSIAKSKTVRKVIVTKRNVNALRETLQFEEEKKKITVLNDNKRAAKDSDLIIISVKAGDAKHVLEEIAEFTLGKIVISLMAAVSIRKLDASLPDAKIVRAMPNIAASIGEAITAYSLGSKITSEKDVEKIQFILRCFGDYVQVPENLMDAVTALSGSGPAYVAVLIEAMVSASLKVGIPRDIAFKLVIKTLTGTANLLSLKKTTMHPAELRDIVTTPSGTTIAGIYELEKGSLRTTVMNAVDAATAAAEMVAKKFEESC